MDIIEFAEKVNKTELTQSQKWVLKQFEEAYKNKKDLFINYPARVGRKQIKDIVEGYKQFLKRCYFCRYIPNDDLNEELESPCLAIHDKKITVYFNGLDREFYNINHCPICGRDLRSEDNG